VKGGHADAGFVVVEFEAAPLAMSEGMLGSSAVMKLPQMVWKAVAKSGPIWPWGGVKYAVCKGKIG
jgi:hypothetical protein